jgi:hypothetical protein
VEQGDLLRSKKKISSFLSVLAVFGDQSGHDGDHDGGEDGEGDKDGKHGNGKVYS